MSNYQGKETLLSQFKNITTLHRFAGRLLLGSLLCLILFVSLRPQSALAHGGDSVAPANAQVYTGLVADSTLCGVGGYRIDDTGLCTHGPDLPPQLEQVQAAHALQANTSASGVVCVGDGVSGKRVQVMYVRTADEADRYAEVVEQIRAMTADVDAIYEASAQETNGHRRIRFVTNAACQLDVLSVELPVNATNTWAATLSALRALGYNNAERKYLLFVDAAIYCGISTIQNDSEPGLVNANNQQAGYARVDRNCWGPMTAAHELTHTLGGVQNDAPHSTGGWHCTDEHDVMCYADSNNAPAMTIVCNDLHHEFILDCNHDDYFSTNPPAGNYLASHWNVANSDFLLHLPDGHPATTSLALATATGITELTPSTPISVAVTALNAASVTDNYVQAMKFFQDGVLVGTTTTAPYTWTWSGASTLGTYVLTVEIDTHDDMRIIGQPLSITIMPADAIVKTVYLPIVNR